MMVHMVTTVQDVFTSIERYESAQTICIDPLPPESTAKGCLKPDI